MRGVSLQQLVFLVALVLWAIFSFVGRARAAASERARAARSARLEVEPIRGEPIAPIAHAPAPQPLPRRVAKAPEDSRKRWDRKQLRAAVVAMTVLGRPRGLD